MKQERTFSLDTLLDVVDLLPSSKAFEARARKAAHVGVHVRRLRDARHSGTDADVRAVGFVEYITQLAEHASVSSASVTAVLEYFGVARGHVLENGTRVARLATGLGMPLRELLIRIRADLAEAGGHPLTALARGRSGGPLSLDQCETSLGDVCFDADTENRLRAFEQKAMVTYERGKR